MVNGQKRGYCHGAIHTICGTTRISPRRPAAEETPMISAIFIVGVPMPTGTDWPSLPQVHVPSDSAKSCPSIVTLRRTSGPLPMRLTPLSGAVSLPSSMR